MEVQAADDDTAQRDDFEDVELDITLVNQDSDTSNDEPVPVEHAQGEQKPDIIPDCTGRTLGIEKRDKVLVQVFESRPDIFQAKGLVGLLNRKGIPLCLNRSQYGGE